MDWDDILYAEHYLRGEICCIHLRFVFPEYTTEGTEEDFKWVKRPDLALVVKGPVSKLAIDSVNQKFTVMWQWLDEVNPDFSLGARLRSTKETGLFDGVRLSTRYHEPRLFDSGVVHLGVEEESADVFLLPCGYIFGGISTLGSRDRLT